MATRIFWIESPQKVRIAISGRPCGGADLAAEIDNWKKRGVNAVVCLLDEQEIRELDLSAEEAACRNAGLEFIHFPINDRGVPESNAAFLKLLHAMETLLAENKSVLIHCRIGLGRSALVAALVLVALGMNIDSAFAAIAAARNNSVPDTIEQREWAGKFAREKLSATRH